MPKGLPRVPVPLRAVGRALDLSIHEVGAYWKQEREALRRGLVALLLSAVAALFAGVVLGSATERLEALPGLLLLIPAAIGMRGANFGALASRLSTGIHTGEFSAELRRGSYLARQVEASAVLTLTTTVEIAVIAWLIGKAFGLGTIPLIDLVVISVVGGVLASVVLLGMTIGLARTAWSRGWNMDDVGAPSITATGDLVTVPMLLVASLLLVARGVTTGLALLSVAAGLWALWHGWRHPAPDVRRIVRESLFVLTIAVLVDVFAGSVIEHRAEELLTIPALLVLIPPFVANCGSLGGILSSRLASKLHLGTLVPRTLPGRLAALDMSMVFLFAVAAFAAVGVVTWLAATIMGLSSPPLVTLLGISLTAGYVSFFLLSAVAYYTAVATFRFGLDPDNHGIPIVTATMDLLGVVCLIGSMILFGVVG